MDCPVAWQKPHPEGRPDQPIRVFHVGLGAMGAMIARALAARSDFSVVGAVSHQAGEDLGELLGTSALGPVLKELPQEAAAELCVIATASTLFEVRDAVLWALTQGMNVISCAEELAFPPAADATISSTLEEAAREAGRTVLGTGINPGYAMDVLPICLTAPCLEVRGMRLRRVNDLGSYGPSVLRAFGVGATPEEFKAGVAAGRIVGHHGFGQSASLIARALGFRIDHVRQHVSAIVARSERRGLDVRVPPGRVAGCLHSAEIVSDGRVVIQMEHPQEIDPGADGTVTGDFIDIDADPPIHLRIEPEIAGGTGTAALVVNMAARVVSAAPGLLTMDRIGLPSIAPPRRAGDSMAAFGPDLELD